MKEIQKILKRGTTCLSNNYVVLFFDPDDEKWNVATNGIICDNDNDILSEIYTIHAETKNFNDAFSIFIDEEYMKEYYEDKLENLRHK